MIRHGLRGLLNTLILLVALLVGALLLMQTSPGKTFLASQLSSMLSTPEAGIEITGIEGWIPGDMRLRNLKLSDRDGVWLEAEGIVADWSPGALFSGRIRIDEVSAERIDVARPPQSSEAPVSDEPIQLPALPKSLPPVTLERLSVLTIDLGASVLGEAASFKLDGSLTARDDGQAADLNLDLQRLDQPTAFATLTSTIALDPPTLAIDLDAGETGGLLAKLTGRADAGNLDLSLTGKGPLDNWSGKLRVDAEGLVIAEADLTLALTDQPRLGIEGAVKPEPALLPAEIEPLVGERLEINLDVIQTRAQTLVIEQADLRVDNAALRASGSVDFERGDLALDAALDMPELAALDELAGSRLLGEAGITMNIAGTLNEPKGRLDLRIKGLAVDDIAVDDIRTGVDLTKVAALDSEQPTFKLSMDGKAAGLGIPGTTIPDPNIEWQAEVTAPLDGTITIETMRVKTADTTLDATGSVDPSTRISGLDLRLDAPSLSRLATPYGQTMDGKGQITAAIRTTEKANKVDIDLDANLTDLAGLPPGAAELLGSQAKLKATIAIDDTKRLSLSDLTINGAEINLVGGADLDLESGDLDGELALALPRLAVLEPLVQQPIEGAVDLKAALGGNVDAPSLDLAVTSQDLVLAGETIKRLDLTLNGRDLIASPNGKLAIDLDVRNIPATLALDYRLDGSKLALPTIALDAPKTKLAGTLVVDLDTSLIDGKLEGGIDDLRALEPLMQQAIDGKIDLAASLSPDGTGQNAVVSLQGQNIEGDFGRITKVKLDGSLQDMLGELGLDAKAAATDFKQGNTEISALTLRAKGNLEQLDFDLDLEGDVTKPLTLSADGSVALSDGFGLDLDRLEGAFAGEAVRQAGPMTFRQSGDLLKLSGLDLRLGKASLTGDIDIGTKTVSGKIDLRSLPLALIERFDGPAIAGTASSDIELSGTTANPEIDAVLNVKDIRADEVIGSDQALDISMQARLADGRLAAFLTGSRLTEKPLTAKASLPVTLRLSPITFDLPKNGKLDGEIKAEIQLARLADILVLDEQIMEGRLTADLAIDGTFAAPLVKGPINLGNGRYENDLTGTNLRDLTMKFIASSERIEIEQFTGKAGKGGTLAVGGWLDLDPAANLPLSVTLRLNNAELVDRDDAKAWISGDIAMSGDMADASIEGTLTVERAEISIQDGGGPNLPELEVEEVGGNIVNPEKREEKSAERPFDPELNMQIKAPNKVYARGRGLESEWLGDLKISGRTSNPRILGNLKVKKGYFDFLDKRFELALGEIRFAGASPPNPILAIEAVSEDKDFKAIIKLNGPATNPKLTLDSEPALPEDEVLARLLFNRDLSEIGPIEAGKLALALNRLRGGGGFDAFGEIRNALNIDTLDVVSGEGAAGSRVKAGKYLNDDVYVEVEKGAGDQSGRARVEVEILPSISLEADTGEDATSGVGLKWKFNY